MVRAVQARSHSAAAATPSGEISATDPPPTRPKEPTLNQLLALSRSPYAQQDNPWKYGRPVSQQEDPQRQCKTERRFWVGQEHVAFGAS
ncbi:hypothetical protein WJX73_009441 [Symbiochloris irregularis]|uniref:Uncharacterized protein n=1 Tax=Symbiochloris irregularis TaxID=706552 RepID=A0AAW1P3E4_9CHLO